MILAFEIKNSKCTFLQIWSKSQALWFTGFIQSYTSTLPVDGSLDGLAGLFFLGAGCLFCWTVVLFCGMSLVWLGLLTRGRGVRNREGGRDVELVLGRNKERDIGRDTWRDIVRVCWGLSRTLWRRLGLFLEESMKSNRGKQAEIHTRFEIVMNFFRVFWLKSRFMAHLFGK